MNMPQELRQRTHELLTAFELVQNYAMQLLTHEVRAARENVSLTELARMAEQGETGGESGPARLSRAQLQEQGKGLRTTCPRSTHGHWTPPADRRDPVALLEESSRGRVPELIPVRYGRMLQSPFTFFRGAAALMAAA